MRLRKELTDELMVNTTVEQTANPLSVRWPGFTSLWKQPATGAFTQEYQNTGFGFREMPFTTLRRRQHPQLGCARKISRGPKIEEV